jgi:hypothetical protein
MTKEALLQRKKALEEARQQHMANANAAAGAIQDCDYWLDQLEQAPPKSE